MASHCVSPVILLQGHLSLDLGSSLNSGGPHHEALNYIFNDSFQIRLHSGGSDGNASAYDAGDPGSIPWLGRSPGEGNGNPLQYSCLENPMDRGAWRATGHGVAKSQTGLSDFTFTFTDVQDGCLGTSLVVQGLRIHLAMEGMWVRSLVR